MLCWLCRPQSSAAGEEAAVGLFLLHAGSVVCAALIPSWRVSTPARGVWDALMVCCVLWYCALVPPVLRDRMPTRHPPSWFRK